MTFDPDLMVGSDFDPVVKPQPVNLVSGRVVSLRFIAAALRRQRRLLLGLALLGLLVGFSYHLVFPEQYSATATLYLVHPPGSDQTVGAANDLAMLQTAAVGKRAITLLGEHDLTPSQLLGKAPGTTVSDNVLTLKISGSSSNEAVRRVNAVATAYLAFRAQVYSAQNQAVVSGANKEIATLQSQISDLGSQIKALESGSQNSIEAQQIASLTAERSADSAQVATVQQTIEQDNTNTLSVTRGSRVIAAGTPFISSKKKLLAVDGLSGLVAGLGLGLMIVVFQAVLSDRLRRREDIAAVLGVPIGISIGRVGRHLPFSQPSIAGMVSAPDPGLESLVQYLMSRVAAGGPKPTEMLIAIDDVNVPAAAMAVLAGTLSSAGKRVLLVDATANRALARALGAPQVGFHIVAANDAAPYTLFVSAGPWESAEGVPGNGARAEPGDIDVRLVIATIDPSVGAWHLRDWTNDAILAVSAGRSTVQWMDAVVELLEASDVKATSAVLLRADADDDSVGLPEPGASVLRRRLGERQPS